MMCAVLLQATAGSRGQQRHLFIEASELQGGRPRRLNGGDAPTAVIAALAEIFHVNPRCTRDRAR